jgi:hypothetical protein
MCINKNVGLLNSVDSNVNHKILEKPTDSLSDLNNNFIPPKTEVERFLATVWAELLRLPQVGTRDNFFDLGGYSLLATQMVAKIYQRYHVEFLVQKIYETPTIFSLAQTIEAAIQCMPNSTQPTNVKQPRKGTSVTGIVPLAPAQAWFLKIQNYQFDRFNIIQIFEVDSHFDPDRLHQVLIHLWKIHDSLRARFIRHGDKWTQIISGPEQSAPDFRVYNLADVSVEDKDRTIEKYTELLLENINITEGPLMLNAYLNFGPKRSGRIILIVHHFLVDAISVSTLIKDLQTAYRQLGEGHAIDLPEKHISIKEWAELLHKYVLSNEHLKVIDYLLTLPWEKIPGLPLDYPQNHDKNLINSIAKITVSLTKEETIILTRKVPLVFNTGVENVLLWALTKVISEWTGGKFVEITVIGNGRNMIPGLKYLDLSRTLGDLATRRTLLLENIKSTDWGQEIVLFCNQLKTIPNNGYDYFLAASINDDSQVIKKLQKIRNIEKYLSFNEIYLNYKESIIENNEKSELKLVRLFTDPYPHNNRLRNFDIHGDIINNCLNIVWAYSYNLYKRETIERLAGKYIRIIKDLIQKVVYLN